MTLTNSAVSRLILFRRSLQLHNVAYNSRLAHAMSVRQVAVPQPSTERIRLPRMPYESVIKDRQVEILTCGALYSQWKKEKRFFNVPDKDLRFSVKYIDTGCGEINPGEEPVVVALHGSPGTYKDFDLVTSSLYHRGVRVIAPLFPGSDTLKRASFRYTPEEKSQYIRDFLQAVGVNRVDMLLCHSSALFPGILLCLEDQKISVNCLGLLNPTTFDIPKLMNPYWVLKFLIGTYAFPVTHQLTNVVGVVLAKTMRKLKDVKYQDQVITVMTMVHSTIPQQAAQFERLLNRNFPVLLAYSENDKLIDKKSSYKMAKMMVDDLDIYRYDAEGKLNRPGSVNPFRKVMAFEKGSHFLFRKHPEIISDALFQFLVQHHDSHSYSRSRL